MNHVFSFFLDVELFGKPKFESLCHQESKKEDPKELPELVYPGISEYPAIEARPPQPTAFEAAMIAVGR